IFENLFFNFFLTLVSRIGGFIFTLIIARSLYPELFGIYSLALTIILTIATFTDLGLNSTLSRYLAEALKIKTEKTEKIARARIYFLLNFKIFLTIITAILLFLLANPIAKLFNKPLLALPLKIGAIYIFIISLHGFFNSIFYAIKKVNYSFFAETIFQFFRIFLVIIFLYILKFVSVAYVFIALIIALFIAFLFLYSIIAIKYSFLIKGKKIKLKKEEKKKLLSFFGWLSISSISLAFFAHIDTLMLGLYLPAEFVGYYNAIFAIVGAVASFLTFGSVLLPIFTQIEHKKLEESFKKVYKYTAIIVIPATIGLAYIIKPGIAIIYGPAYLPQAYKIAIIITSIFLSLLIFESAFSSIYSSLFQAKEMPKIPSLLIIISSVINIILNYIFIRAGISIAQQYGLVGVALATLLARYSNMIGLAFFSRKKLKMKINTTLLLKPLLASLIMLAFLFAFDWLVPLSVLTGILMIITAVLIYFLALWIVKGISKEDFELIRRL
ncbi:MAG: oligosaccharide flippase family protein, partial [Candidatus Pacearchaeota archaeon]